MNQAKEDGGREYSADGVEMFVQKWNARNPKRAVECPVRPIPAVVKIPRADGGEMRVWVKTLGHEAADVYLSRDDSIHGNFLVVIRFLDSERSRADFHIMTDKEVEQLREQARSGTILKSEAVRACGQESWDKLENAVQI